MTLYLLQKPSKHFLVQKKPINYVPKLIPRSQDLNPIVFETTALYGIKKKALEKNKCRIGKKPYFFEVDDFETIDLNNSKDFEYLEYLIKNNLSDKKKFRKKKRVLKYLNFL